MIDKSDNAELERAEKAVKEIFELVLSPGGTISGEHGIGISKMSYIGMELSPTAMERSGIAAMRSSSLVSCYFIQSFNYLAQFLCGYSSYFSPKTFYRKCSDLADFNP